MTTFRTSADATRASQRELANIAARSITAKRTDKLIRPLREKLALLTEQDPSTPPAHVYGYGLVELPTTRVFREIDSQGRLHVVDAISGDQIADVFAYLIDATSSAVVFPGNFPGQLRPDGEVFSGRFSGTGSAGTLPPNGTQIRLFKGDQLAADPDLVAQTGLDSQFIGAGYAWVWSRFVFQDGVYNSDPGLRVIARSRKVLDPRTASTSAAFANQPKTFSINPYRFIFDYLARPKRLGGAGIDLDFIDIDSFIDSTIWSEQLVDTRQSSAVALFTTRTNQITGTPPINTNHIFEFETDVCPFQYGDVVQLNVAGTQQLPSNFSSNTDYHVIPIRHQINDFQLPGIALAATLEDALNGNSIPQGTRNADITVTKVKEIRFQSGAVYRSGERILDVLLESCGARLYRNRGKIAITRQVFPEPEDITTVSIDELIGAIAISTSIDDDERATALVGSYSSITNLFIEDEYPEVNGDGLFEAEDAQRSARSYDLPFVAKASVAQRLATIELRKRRQEKALAFSGDLSLFRLRPNSIFDLGFPKYGLDPETTFEVREQTVFLRVTNGVPFVGVNIEARQLEAATFDLTIDNEAFVAAARIPGLQSPFDVPPPGALAIAEQLYQTRLGAGVRSRAIVSWLASAGRFVLRYEVSLRREGQTAFTFLAETPELTVTIDDLQPGRYDFRVVAVNSVNRRSLPAERNAFTIQGLAAKPSAPSGFIGQVIGGATVLLRWARTTDLDVREGGFVEVRHAPQISGAEAKDSVFIDSDVGGQTSLAVPFRQGTYFLRFEDSTGQFSDPVAWSTQSRRPVALAQVPPSFGAALVDGADGDDFTLQEDPSFPSSNPGNTLIVVGGDHLELPLEDTLDDEADFDAIPNVDLVGGGAVTPSGLWFFTTSIEVDDITRLLVEAVIETEVFDLSSSLDDEPDFDAITNIDNVAAGLLQPGLATAEIQVRFSNGTVASDTFGPWETIDTQYIETRSLEFRVLAKSFVPSVNIRVNQARVRMRAVPL